MRPAFGDDYALAAASPPCAFGKDMQFFGARANLAKLVLLAINGGMDEVKRPASRLKCLSGRTNTSISTASSTASIFTAIGSQKLTSMP